jgi:hypothetical protein
VVDEGWNCVLARNPRKDTASAEKGEMQVLLSKVLLSCLFEKEGVALL